MKANRKFLRGDDEGVSPVIAVILMVAITVVLAATVYVWVSGFGSSTNGSPAHTLSLSSGGAVTFTENGTTDYTTKRYTVASADPSLTYGDLKMVIGGTEYNADATDAFCSAQTDLGDNEYVACAGGVAQASTDGVSAGDLIVIKCEGATDCLSDEDLLILDVEANSVMVTLKVR